MNLIEVVQELDKLPQDKRTKVWFRSVNWRKARFALVVDAYDFQHVLAVPDPRGGHRATFPSFDDALGEWEIVSMDEVLGGK